MRFQTCGEGARTVMGTPRTRYLRFSSRFFNCSRVPLALSCSARPCAAFLVHWTSETLCPFPRCFHGSSSSANVSSPHPGTAARVGGSAFSQRVSNPSLTLAPVVAVRSPADAAVAVHQRWGHRSAPAGLWGPCSLLGALQPPALSWAAPAVAGPASAQKEAAIPGLKVPCPRAHGLPQGRVRWVQAAAAGPAS